MKLELETEWSKTCSIHLLLFSFCIFTRSHSRSTEYCDDCVCLSACTHISGITRVHFSENADCGHGLVLLWRRMLMYFRFCQRYVFP